MKAKMMIFEMVLSNFKDGLITRKELVAWIEAHLPYVVE